MKFIIALLLLSALLLSCNSAERGKSSSDSSTDSSLDKSIGSCFLFGTEDLATVYSDSIIKVYWNADELSKKGELKVLIEGLKKTRFSFLEPEYNPDDSLAERTGTGLTSFLSVPNNNLTYGILYYPLARGEHKLFIKDKDGGEILAQLAFEFQGYLDNAAQPSHNQDLGKLTIDTVHVQVSYKHPLLVGSENLLSVDVNRNDSLKRVWSVMRLNDGPCSNEFNVFKHARGNSFTYSFSPKQPGLYEFEIASMYTHQKGYSFNSDVIGKIATFSIAVDKR